MRNIYWKILRNISHVWEIFTKHQSISMRIKNKVFLPLRFLQQFELQWEEVNLFVQLKESSLSGLTRTKHQHQKPFFLQIFQKYQQLCKLGNTPGIKTAKLFQPRVDKNGWGNAQSIGTREKALISKWITNNLNIKNTFCLLLRFQTENNYAVLCRWW